MSTAPVASPPRSSIKPFLIGWCVYLIATELYGFIFLGKELAAYRPFDFQSFYVAEYLARTNPVHLYDLARQAQLQTVLTSSPFCLPFYHPSYEPFLLSPLSLLGFRSSYFAWIALNSLILLCVFFAARQTFSSPIPWLQPRSGLILFVFIPLLNAIFCGQDSLISLLLYCLTWRQLEAGKDRSAGFFLGLALFKFQIVLAVAALIAIRKGWRFMSGFLVAALGLVLFSVGIVGPAGTAAYIRLLLNAGTSLGQSKLAMLKMGITPLGMPNLAGLLYACGGRFLHSPTALNVLIAICSLAIFAWCARVVRHIELEVMFSIAVICGLLVSFHLFFYDLTLLLLPVALLGSRINRYVLLSLFGLPLILNNLPSNLSFILAIPTLVVLVSVLVKSSRTTALNNPVVLEAH